MFLHLTLVLNLKITDQFDRDFETLLQESLP